MLQESVPCEVQANYMKFGERDHEGLCPIDDIFPIPALDLTARVSLNDFCLAVLRLDDNNSVTSSSGFPDQSPHKRILYLN